MVRWKAGSEISRKASASSSTSARFGSSEAFLDANTQSTARGFDAPTFDAIHDNSSQSDQFFRFITQLTPRSTLAFDYSNQLAIFQIPINTDPNNPYDPITTPASTDDVQREYDRFSNVNWTTRLQGRQRDLPGDPMVALDAHQLRRRPSQRRDWSHARLQRRRTAVHAVPAAERRVIGAAAQRRSALEHLRRVCRLASFRLPGNEEPCVEGRRRPESREPRCRARPLPVTTRRAAARRQARTPNRTISLARPNRAQAGSQTGIYGQDTWTIDKYVKFNYGLRYDHSTGYTSGWMFSPRLGLNVWDGGKNTATFSTGASTPRRCSRTSVKTASLLARLHGAARVQPPARARRVLRNGLVDIVQPAAHRLVQSLPQDRRSTFSTRRSCSIRRSLPSSTTRSASITAPSCASRSGCRTTISGGSR